LQKSEQTFFKEAFYSSLRKVCTADHSFAATLGVRKTLQFMLTVMCHVCYVCRYFLLYFQSMCFVILCQILILHILNYSTELLKFHLKEFALILHYKMCLFV
jgi:hypothetical protein